MPARKPSHLSSRHSTKAELAARTDAESALTPLTELTVTPPPELHGNKYAIAVWKRHVKLYAETEGTIITAFDADLLVKYCKLEAECLTFEDLCSELMEEKIYLTKEISRLKRKAKKTTEEVDEYISYSSQRIAVAARYQGLDARLDGKRKLLHALAQSLYLTPRSRAGVDPKRKGEETPDPLKEFD